MRNLAIAVALLVLAGCVSNEAAFDQDDAYCQRIGLEPGSGAYADCMLRLVDQRTERRRSVGSAMSNYGRTLMQGHQGYNAPPRPVTCTTHRGMITSTTTCY